MYIPRNYFRSKLKNYSKIGFTARGYVGTKYENSSSIAFSIRRGIGITNGKSSSIILTAADCGSTCRTSSRIGVSIENYIGIRKSAIILVNITNRN
jgi:hypothetical protein